VKFMIHAFILLLFAVLYERQICNKKDARQKAHILSQKSCAVIMYVL